MGRLTPLGEQLYGITDNDKAKEIEKNFSCRMGIDPGSPEGDTHAETHWKGGEINKINIIQTPRYAGKSWAESLFREACPEGDYSPEIDLSGRSDKIFPNPVEFDPWGEHMNFQQKLDHLSKTVDNLYNLPKPKRKRHVLKRYKRSRFR